MNPTTRKETFLAKAGGKSVNTPKPRTREEMFLQKIAESGGGTGGGSGGTNIDVAAEVGQIIRVKAVGDNGKPTEWESAEYPVGAKIYTVAELEQMTYEELSAEYNKHPIILRYGKAGNYVAGDILLHNMGALLSKFYGGSIGSDNRLCVTATVKNNPQSGKLVVDVKGWSVPLYPTDETEEGFAYRNSTGHWITVDIADYINIDTPMAELPAEHLVDGVTIPMDYDSYAYILTKYEKNPNIIIRTTIDNKRVDLNALSLSVDVETYATAVRVLSPTTNDIITLNFALATE